MGQVPKPQRHVEVILIPKDSGGLRPIMLFGTLTRVMMKAYYGAAVEWQNNFKDAEINMAPGRGVGDATWRQQIRRELFQEGLAKHHGGEVLLDLMKCYEHVDREILIKWGQFFGYPGAYLRFSIAAYGWGRNMKWQGIYAKKVFAQRGIAAGSVAAPIELVVYLLAGIRKLKRRSAPFGNFCPC